ncbi:MFS transporter [Williamsia sterculiae]|uniref:Predicted arabinose efflux permease, MFS family n=1 Tax=Williamsia sterculiae TaxID=1344003 RepID=A0A1N7GVK3_9NOCA|nr:MFS transporter [Williamsia sterculiae]SIS16617.1 Predicted arabinose efflux permease, MFS family [Williamsia sterculiae]
MADTSDHVRTSDRADPADRAVATYGLMLVLIVVMFGTTMPTAVYSTYEREIGFSLHTVTVIFATYALGVLASLLAFGRWSDVLGRRPVLLFGLGFAVVSDVVFLFADDVPLLLLGRLLSGLSAGIFVGTASVAITEMARGRLVSRAPTLATIANIGGLGLGPIIAAMVVTWLPAPTRTTYVVHLGACVVAVLIVLVLPETRGRQRDKPLRFNSMAVPEDTRRPFIRASLLGFAGFALLGLFTGVAPTIATEVTGVHQLIGVVLLASTTFFGSVAGQVAARGIADDRAEPLAVGLFVCGTLALVLTFWSGWWEMLAVAGIVGGIGQGIGFAKGLAVVTRTAPVDQRAAVASAFFVVCYVAISVPVIAEGLLANAWTITGAGVVFAFVVMGLALLSGVLGARERAQVR